MKKVNLYIEASSTAFQKRERICGYVLEYMTASGIPVTGTAFLEGDGTYNRETLRVLADALGHMRQPCQLKLYGKNVFVLNAVRDKLKDWADKDFLQREAK